MGASWDAFRLDLTVHPFQISFGQDDIRLTTRYAEDDLNALFTAMHECGHGLYEWGSAPSLTGRRSAGCMSSTLSPRADWENVVGRSLPFWRWFLRACSRPSRTSSATSRSSASTAP